MSPDRKVVVNGKLVEEYYWAGKYIAYIDGRLFPEGFDAAIKFVTPAPQPDGEEK